MTPLLLLLVLADPVAITVTTAKWSLTAHHAQGQVHVQGEILVPRGEDVVLIFKSQDLARKLEAPGLDVSLGDAKAAQVIVHARFDSAGTFEVACSGSGDACAPRKRLLDHFSSAPWPKFAGRVVVVPREQYDAWLNEELHPTNLVQHGEGVRSTAKP